jgi:subtilase family serine protease
MVNAKIIVLMILLFVVVGCKPDLAVENVGWDSPTKTATATIKNIGKADAGNFMVYFNGDENPVSQNYRPQVSHSAPGLPKGQSITLTAPFGPLARPENNYLRNVYQITVLADPKNTVKEANEGNNSKSIPVQIP